MTKKISALVNLLVFCYGSKNTFNRINNMTETEKLDCPGGGLNLTGLVHRPFPDLCMKPTNVPASPFCLVGGGGRLGVRVMYVEMKRKVTVQINLD
ncbi:hypothetical protein CEXT_234371 [Caerostris extrusa]|uniref:Uncharacterized protein n=1 Tax=Caerostris extrusa TaxID=172846 RepID=A0AAV4VBS8_CAEEX|nr:hypothetical protein CEXT_234371 [Caerostris extrusa]